MRERDDAAQVFGTGGAVRKNIRVITSLACGALALMLAVAYGEAAKAEVRAERSEVLERYGGEVTSLVVARTELSAGEVVSESTIEVREWLSDLAPEGAITKVDDVVGLRLSASVAKGEPLNQLDVVSQEGTLDIPEGRVAIAVHVSDKTGLVQNVGMGSRVLCYRTIDNALRSICSDALVISNSNVSVSAYATSSNSSICIAVLPEYVEETLAASSDGSLRLALPGDGVDMPEASAPQEVAPIENADEQSSDKDEQSGDESEKANDLEATGEKAAKVNPLGDEEGSSNE